MTHKDIYTKFMIEYDKANVTSSYPSLTEYEVATVLDKAYNALIAQKVTGNNIRRVALEGDLKNVVDLQPLIIKKTYIDNEIHSNVASYDDIDNTLSIELPKDFLYYVGCDIKKEFKTDGQIISHYSGPEYVGPIDLKNVNGPVNVRYRRMPIRLISHQMAENFKASSSNIPWIKNPVCYIEDDTIFIVYDSYDQPLKNFCELTYIKTPSKFVKDFIRDDRDQLAIKIGEYIKNKYPEEYANVDEFNRIINCIQDNGTFEYNSSSLMYEQVIPPIIDWNKMSYFEDPHITVDTSDNYEIKAGQYSTEFFLNAYTFECNDTVAEELISLAVAFALENVESQRLNSKLNMRGLEA